MFSRQHPSWQPASRRRVSIAEVAHLLNLYEFLAGQRGVEVPEKLRRKVAQANERTDDQHRLPKLSLKKGKIGDDQVKVLALALWECPIVGVLDLRHNQITHHGVSALMELVRHQMVLAKAAALEADAHASGTVAGATGTRLICLFNILVEGNPVMQSSVLLEELSVQLECAACVSARLGLWFSFADNSGGQKGYLTRSEAQSAVYDVVGLSMKHWRDAEEAFGRHVAEKDRISLPEFIISMMEVLAKKHQVPNVDPPKIIDLLVKAQQSPDDKPSFDHFAALPTPSSVQSMRLGDGALPSPLLSTRSSRKGSPFFNIVQQARGGSPAKPTAVTPGTKGGQFLKAVLSLRSEDLNGTPVGGPGLDAAINAATHSGQPHGGVELHVPGTPLPHSPRHLTFGSTAAGGGHLVPPSTEAQTPPLGPLTVATRTDSKDGEVAGSVQAPPSIAVSVAVEGEQKSPTAQSPTSSKSKVRLSAIAKRLEVQAKQQADSTSPSSGQRPRASSRSRALSNVSSRAGSPSRRSSRSPSPAPTRSPSVRAGSVTSEDGRGSPKPRSSSVFSDGEDSELVVHHDRARQVGGRAAASRRRSSRAGTAGAGAAAAMMGDDAVEEQKPRTLSPTAEPLSPGELRRQTSNEGERRRRSLMPAREDAEEESEQLVTDTSAGVERVESLTDTPDLPGGETEHTSPMPSAALLPLPPDALPPDPPTLPEAGVEEPEASVLDRPSCPLEAETPHGAGATLPSVLSEEIKCDDNAALSPGPVSYEQRLQTAESFVPVARQGSAEQQQQLIPGEEEEEGEGRREQGQSTSRQASAAPQLEPQTSTEASAASRLQLDDSQDSGGNVVSHSGDDENQFADVDGRGQVDDETADPFEECATSRESDHDSLEEHRPLEPFRPAGVSVYTTCCTVKITERDIYDDAEDGAWVITEERLAVQGCGVTHIDLAPTVDGHNLSETLLTLSLASNQLACIDAEALAFSSMQNLTSLNLSHNLIKKMVCLNGQYPSKLRSLDLSDNLICVISGLESCVQLSKLNLAANRLTYVDGLCLLDSLQELDISDNRIKKAIGLRGLAFSPSLRVLIVRGNHIASKANGHTAIRAFAPKVEFLDGKDIRRRFSASSKAQKQPPPQQRPVAHMTRAQQGLADKARSAIRREKFKALQKERERLLKCLLGKPPPTVSANHQRRQINMLSVPKKKGNGMRRDFYMAFGRHTDSYNNPPPPPTYVQNSAAPGMAMTVGQKLLAAQHKAEQEAANHAYVQKSVPRGVVMTVAQKLLAAQHKAEEEASQRPDKEAAHRPLDAHSRPPTLAEKLIAAGRRMQQELASRRQMGSPTSGDGNSRGNAPASVNGQRCLSGCAVDVVVQVRVDDWVADLEQSIGTTRSVLAQALQEETEGGLADSAALRRLQRLCEEVKVLADPSVPVAVQQLIDSSTVTLDYRPLQHGLDLLGQDAEARKDLRELLKMVTTPPEGVGTRRENCDRLRIKYALSADSRARRLESEVPAVTPDRPTTAHGQSVSRSHAPTTQSTQSPIRCAAASAEGPGGDGSPHELSSLSVSAASDAQHFVATAEHVGPGTAAVQSSTPVPVISASVNSQDRRSEGSGGYSGCHSSPRAEEIRGNPRSPDLASQSGHGSGHNVASSEARAPEELSPTSTQYGLHDSRSPRPASPSSSSPSRSTSRSPIPAAPGSFMSRCTRTSNSPSPRHSSPQEGPTSPPSSANNTKRRQQPSSSPLPDAAVQLYPSDAAGRRQAQQSVSPTPSVLSKGRARQETAGWSSRPTSPAYAPGSATSSQGFAVSPRQGLYSPDRSVSGRSASERAEGTLHTDGEQGRTGDHGTEEEYEWIEGYNDDYQHFFYYHEKTGVSQWEKPDAPYLPYDPDAEEENGAEEEGEVEDAGEAVPHDEESELVGDLSPRSHLDVLPEGEEADEDSVAKSPRHRSKVSPSERSRSSIGTLDFSDESRPARIDVISGQRHESASSSLPSIGHHSASRHSADAREGEGEDARLDKSQQSSTRSGSVTSGQAERSEPAAATSSSKPMKRSFPSFLSLSSRQSHRGPSAAGETPDVQMRSTVSGGEVRRSGSWTFLTRKNSSSASEQR